MVMLALVAVACGGGGDDDKKVATGATTTSTVAGATTTTTAGDPGATTTTTAEAGTDTTVAGGPGTTAAGPGPGPATTPPPATAPPGPVALTPATPGVYHYLTTGSVTFNGSPVVFPPDTTNTIGAAAGSRQVATRDLGSGSQVTYTFDYRPDGLYLVSLVFTTTYNGVAYPFALTPPAPLLFLATGAATGASQTLTIPAGGGSATVVVDVLGTEPVAVGGQSIDTLIVRSVATFPPGQIQGSQTLFINLDRASRLWVRERAIGDATAGGLLTVHTEYNATIKSLTPG